MDGIARDETERETGRARESRFYSIVKLDSHAVSRKDPGIHTHTCAWRVVGKVSKVGRQITHSRCCSQKLEVPAARSLCDRFCAGVVQLPQVP